jgi:GT2 family glycosyltransferase
MENNAEVGILALNVTTGPYLTEGRWVDRQDTYGFYGCGGIIRKEVYEKIGGFSEWLTVYAHEWDYGLRALDAGYKIKYYASSNVIHRASTINRSAKRYWIYSTRNEMSLVYKFFDKSYRRKILLNMFVNNFKAVKGLQFSRIYYCQLGLLKFLRFRKTLPHTPLKRDVQVFFAQNHLNTYPPFAFITRAINRVLR